MSPFRKIAALGVISVATLALVACGGDDGTDTIAGTTTPTDVTSTPTDGSATVAPTEDAASDGPSAVAYSLADFSIEGPATVAAGDVEFTVKNDGAVEHSFELIRSDAAATELPIADGEVDASALDVVGEIGAFGAGEEKSETWTLDAGRYLLICNVPGHYELGMVTELIVE